MGREQGYINHHSFQVLEFYCSFYTAKSSSVGWNRCTFQIQTSSSLSISAQGFLRINTDLILESAMNGSFRICKRSL